MSLRVPIRLRDGIHLLLALSIYAFLAYYFDFVQDDAFITFRYAANYLDGHGLVFNIGERVEGYTNFGWLIYLVFWGGLGVGFIAASKLTGLVLGAAMIFMYFLIARRVAAGGPAWTPIAVVYLLAVNPSLAYWAPAGLETAAFGFCVAGAMYAFLISSRSLIVFLTWSMLLRPEGILVGALLVLIEIFRTREWFGFSLKCFLLAIALLLPYWGFKLTYYGYLLPNSFYAKTAFDTAQFQNGLEYAGSFFRHYGFFGLGILVPLILRKHASRDIIALVSFSVLYTLYIVSVGGDVLKVHRFFIPILGMVAVLSVVSVVLLTRRLGSRWRALVRPGVMVLMLGYTLAVPHDYVASYQYREAGFTDKMKRQAQLLKASDASAFSVALPTIGAFGFELMGHRIIDMLGLTDSTIARHPQPPIAGITSTWWESKYNCRYLLEQAPDYILFSTGVKPSAPAERALCLYPPFLISYRTLSWYDEPDGPGSGSVVNVFKKVHPLTGKLEPVYSPEYIDYFSRGLYAKNIDTALDCFMKALATEPSPPNMNLVFCRAQAHLRLGQVETARRLLDAMVAYDSLIPEAHMQLYRMAAIDGDRDKADAHRRWLLQLEPWYVPRLDSLVRAAVANNHP